jgi:hypothetical protein
VTTPYWRAVIVLSLAALAFELARRVNRKRLDALLRKQVQGVSGAALAGLVEAACAAAVIGTARDVLVVLIFAVAAFGFAQ